ncbi:MAG: hypothetical protein IPG88_26600, partial [Gemmatimonadetes bacterium]|nr:hypothetical protein [Gemmatimonadota bacterium]
ATARLLIGSVAGKQVVRGATVPVLVRVPHIVGLPSTGGTPCQSSARNRFFAGRRRNHAVSRDGVARREEVPYQVVCATGPGYTPPRS